MSDHAKENPKPDAGGGGHNEEGEHPEQAQDNVTIIVDNEPRSIHRGRRSVAEIKEAGGVPPAHELEQVVEGVLTPLSDDAAITIKGGERFVSHPRTGTSS